MLLFMKYNLRAIGWEISKLKKAPEAFVSPNHVVLSVAELSVDHHDQSESDISQSQSESDNE